MATTASPPSDDSGGIIGAIGSVFTKAKNAVADTVAPLAPKTPPPTLPGAAPEAPGKTLTGGRRRKTRGGKRRSTRKTTGRVRKSKKGGRNSY
jgi:hypothetical protein